MPDLNKYKQLIYLVVGSLFLVSMLGACKDKGEDKDLYLVNDEKIYPPGTIKTKEKTEEQYVAILYSNLFQKSLSANELYDVKRVIDSKGDKELVREILISNFMNKPDVIIPSDSLMRADVKTFVNETYKRFFVRYPSEAELTYMTNYINGNPNITADMVYFAYGMSNEYLFY